MDLSSNIDRKLRNACNKLLEYLNTVKVVSRLELFVQAREALQSQGGLTDDETKFIVGKYDLRPDQLLVISIIGDTPYMMGCPFLHEETIFKNKLFYHSHTFSPSEQDYETALERSRYMKLSETTKMIDQMLSRAGYSKANTNQETRFTTYRKENGKELRVNVLLSISDTVQLLDVMPEGMVFVVPTEESPGPFISFYRNQRMKAAEKRFSIIVVNVEDLKISPFLGYPPDNDLLPLFTEPDLAARIKTVWGEDEDTEQML